MRYALFLLVVQGYAAFNLTWGAPAISLDGNPPLGDTDTNAAIALDPFGNAAAVWGRTASGQAVQDIWASVYNHGSRVWTGSAMISSGSNASNAKVVMDKEGNALFVWEEGFPSQVVYRHLSSKGVWGVGLSSPPQVVKSSSYSQLDPRLVVDEGGDVLAVWMEFRNGDAYICSAEKEAGGAWVDLGPLGKGEWNGNNSLVMNPEGNALVAWQAEGHVWAASYNEGWSAPVLVGVGGSAAVALDQEGDGLVVWDCEGIICSRRLDEGEWGELFTVSSTEYVARHPDVAMDRKGNAVVVFERSDALHTFICSAALEKGAAGWSASRDLSPPSIGGAAGAGFPVLAINEIGDGVVVWKEFNGESMVVQGAGFSLGTWSTTKSLSMDGHVAELFVGCDLDVAVNAAGNIVAIWPEDPTGDGSQQIKVTFGVGLANASPFPPVPNPITIEDGIAWGKQIAHRFPAHLDLINILNWATTTPASYYRVYRGSLSNLIGTSNTTYFEDHQRTRKKNETYLITCVDANEQESAPMTLVVHPK